MFSKMCGRLAITGVLKTTNPALSYMESHGKKMNFLSHGLSVLLITSYRISQFACLILTPPTQKPVSHFDKEQADFGS